MTSTRRNQRIAGAAFGLGVLVTPAYAQQPGEVTAPAVEVVSGTPIPGLGIALDKLPGNAQTISTDQISAQHPIGLNELLEEQAGSVTVTNFQGNPFQPDVSYRGFTASPLLGTPQGLSVYLDGVRVNEPFGDVVNWDLIPINALRRIDVIPGSNPLYGLNTLGGALALHTKDGFTEPGAYGEVSGGSWGRRNAWAEFGGSHGDFGVYLNVNHFKEDGWRDLSPSEVNQVFGKGSFRTDRTSIDLSVIYAKTDLTGNGATPQSMLDNCWNCVFTVPDQTKNELVNITLSGTQWLNDNNQIGGDVYYRRGRQNTSNGDLFDDFEGNTDFDGATGAGGGAGVSFDPVLGYAPTGVFNRTSTDQDGEGAAAQYTLVTERNRFTLGSTFDTSHVNFRQTQQLGILDDQRVVIPAPGLFSLFSGEVLSNTISGTYQTTSAFFTDTWTVHPKVNVTLSGRYNVTRVGTDLAHNLNAEELDSYTGVDDFDTSSETFTYRKFNPAAGITWNPRRTLTLYGNFSQGSRVPSPIELGCANPNTACTIPTALTDDPFLPQVVARTYELGARGTLAWLHWSFAVYRTNLTDDILFISSPTNPQQGYFSSFGKTRRQGIELGLGGNAGRLTWRAAYSFLDATFQSPASLVNEANSSSNADGVYAVEPGDKLPGLPQHQLKVSGDYRVWRGWAVGGSMLAQSYQYVRGNENNQHQAGGTDADGHPFVGDGKTGGFAIFNLRTRYDFESGLTLFGEIANVFDRHYYTAGALGVNPFVPGAGGIQGANGFNYNSDAWQNVTSYVPGAPRAFWVGVGYAFPARKTASATDSD